MPVLLLARGDQESKALLRRAIEARYGLGPPVLETLKLQFKGRARTKLGPVTAWVPLEVRAYFKFGFSVRWDFVARPVGVALSSGSEAFDGTVWRRRHSHDPVVSDDDAQQVASMRARLWIINALLLTPLGDHFVELKATGERSFEATHREMRLTARLRLNADDTLEVAEIECLNPATDKIQTYAIRPSDGQTLVGSLILPRKISFAWDHQTEVELTPTQAESNLPLNDSLFRLEGN
ncbi:MAG: hypothetical protein ABI835_17235 [Chloroflexota bacterium]